MYATLNADFLAATQLVVYAGGVVILMLFAVMLTGGVQAGVNKFGIEKIPDRWKYFLHIRHSEQGNSRFFRIGNSNGMEHFGKFHLHQRTIPKVQRN